MHPSSIRSRSVVLVGLFAALMSIGAYIQVPTLPVAISLQSLIALLSGLVLGPRLGALSQLVYIGLGLAGIPVFTGGGGIAYLFKPSFGYLVGFIPAAWMVGRLIKGGEPVSMSKLSVIAVGTHLMIYAVGLPYLYVSLRLFGGTPVAFSTLVKTGFLLFLPGDLLKSIFFVAIAPRILSHYTLRGFRETC